MDEIDYYLPEREYDTEEGATYETEAEKAGIKPGSLREQVRSALGSGNSGKEEKSMRESVTVGSAPQPSESVAVGQGPEVPPVSEETTYTTPTTWGKENIAEVNDIMGGTPTAAPETVWERGLRSVQTVAMRAADIFTRSRGGF
jgi:hypothetical protein